MGGQFGEVISDPKTEFRVSWPSLTHGSRGSSPGRSPAKQAASRSARSLEKDSRDSKGIAVLSRTDQFLHTISRSGKITHANDPALTSLPLESLPLLHRSAPAGNPLSIGNNRCMVGYRVDILQGVTLLIPQPDLYLCTDSSMEELGASLSGRDVKDIWR